LQYIAVEFKGKSASLRNITKGMADFLYINEKMKSIINRHPALDAGELPMPSTG